MWLNWVPYRGRDFASYGAFLRNTLRKAWQHHFDEEFLGKGAGCGESIESDWEDPRLYIITISLYRRRSIHWRRSINRGRAGLQLRGDLRNFGHQLPCGKSIFPDFVLGLRIGPDLLDNRGYRDLGLTIGTIVIKDRICSWWRTGRRGRQEIDDFRNLAPRPP